MPRLDFLQEMLHPKKDIHFLQKKRILYFQLSIELLKTQLLKTYIQDYYHYIQWDCLQEEEEGKVSEKLNELSPSQDL